MPPHYSRPSRDNTTPSSGTSPLACCEGVPPPDSHAVQETLQTRLPFPQPSGRPFRLGDLT